MRMLIYPHKFIRYILSNKGVLFTFSRKNCDLNCSIENL